MQAVQPQERGLDAAQLDRVIAVLRNDIERKLYDGAVAVVARGGQVALHQALGFAGHETARLVQTDDVFYLFSVAKALTGASVQLILVHWPHLERSAEWAQARRSSGLTLNVT